MTPRPNPTFPRSRARRFGPAKLDTFETRGDKEWIEATVTIDGTRFEQVGLRLKGNSSLMGLRQEGGDAESPETLPWRIRLDKNVDGQEYLGDTEFVVRSNSSATSLNEAVALDLLQAAGLASQTASSKPSFPDEMGERRPSTSTRVCQRIRLVGPTDPLSDRVRGACRPRPAQVRRVP